MQKPFSLYKWKNGQLTRKRHKRPCSTVADLNINMRSTQSSQMLSRIDDVRWHELALQLAFYPWYASVRRKRTFTHHTKILVKHREWIENQNTNFCITPYIKKSLLSEVNLVCQVNFHYYVHFFLYIARNFLNYTSKCTHFTRKYVLAQENNRSPSWTVDESATWNDLNLSPGIIWWERRNSIKQSQELWLNFLSIPETMNLKQWSKLIIVVGAFLILHATYSAVFCMSCTLFPSSPFLSFILSPMLVHHIWLDSRASIMLLHHVLCHLSWFLNRQEEFLRRSREDSIFCSSYSLLLCPLFIIQCSQ